MKRYFDICDGMKFELERRYNNESHGKKMHSQEDMGREFPINKKNLVEKYCNLERILNERWHPNATLGAAIHGDGLLTDHGVEHIAAVMHHANEILGPNLRYLSGYEIYLLLIAIHFHDLGNIYGRSKHEQKIIEVMDAMGDSLEIDAVEKEFVIAIAKSHGGYCGDDKDTIRWVNVDETCNGMCVRAKMLASILRFADELSDDFTRTSYKGIEVPKENEAYHMYSTVLEPVSVQGETIKFHFRIPKEYTQNPVGKGSKEIYLYDEVLERLTKCMRELEYCRKYSNGFINITTLNVKIDIMSLLRIKESIAFRLTLLGYPNVRESSLESYMDRVVNIGDEMIKSPKYENGEELKKAMKEE